MNTSCMETPKSHIQRKSWVDKKKISETPQSTSDALHKCYNTFPRRSQRVKYLHSSRSIMKSIYTQMEKQHVKAFVLKNRKIPFKKVLGEYQSEEDTSSCIRKQRFMMENCNNITDNTHKSRQNEDLNISVKLLNVELEHHRSLNKFHLQCRYNNLNEKIEIENV
ncbi:PREDICTED: uncharacterized protein LOC105561737 [Vollenhovia emeryi]|uniref:uncharacterized protein LOC105561737 n=1 Tax=Vollenhovia emeryi TaxID=411798 RepID=UPI0005F4F330|nr:PREDICTED: uncharacterized protein LOC105561737 [Vollenhovia emeryi]